MTIKVDIRLVIQACVASDGTPLGRELEKIVQSAAEVRSKGKGALMLRHLAQLHTAGGDSILPFELAPFELSLACLLASQPSFMEPSRYPNSDEHYAKIFSNWSLVDSGYVLMTTKKCVYVPNATCYSPQKSKAKFEIRPTRRLHFARAVSQLTDAQPDVRVESDNNIKFTFNTGTTLNNLRMECRCWILGLSGGPELLAATRLSMAGSQRLTLEFLRPEAILQLSAAASRGHWLHIEGLDLDIIFRVPDISSDGQSCKFWSPSFVAGNGYLESSISGNVDLPKYIAKECIRRYWWMTLSDKEFMLNAMSE